MKRHFHIGLVLIFIMTSCVSSILYAGQEERIRMPVRAGQYYPDTRKELQETVDRLLRQTEAMNVGGEVVGIWVPHAGYDFSGKIAANGYRFIQNMEVDAVIIVGTSHFGVHGGSIGDWGAYMTPLGKAVVDTQLAEQIRSNSELIGSIHRVHQYEHSVEVQIPFIQTVLPGTPIVPMVVAGDLTTIEARKIADAIVEAAIDKKVIMIASSDMSHYPSYKDAYEVDLRVLDKVGDFDPRAVLRFNSAIMKEGIPGLDCAMCGSGALATVMYAAKSMNAKRVKVLPYMNSGDVSGERHRVVGYGAAVFYRQDRAKREGGENSMDEIVLTEGETQKLFRIARESITSALKKERAPEFSIEEPNLLLKRGVFVTLMNRGRLRGCIGHFEPDYPLSEIVTRMSVAAATQDYRFAYDPVTLEEMAQIEIKISILSSLKKINSVEEIDVGKHGIWITQGNRGGTYLPEVAVEMGWNRTEFLEHCCVEKAGLDRNAWKHGAEIYIYSSQILSDKAL